MARSSSRSVRLVRWCAVLAFAAVALAPIRTTLAASNQDVVRALVQTDVYITPESLPAGHLRPGDQQRLQAQADAANARGIPEKFAIIAHFRPQAFHSAMQAAADLRHLLDFSGVLVLVSPLGLGIDSDQLTSSQIADVTREAEPRCATQSYTRCVIFAGQRAVPLARADKNSAFHDAAIFWSVVLAAMAVCIAIAALLLRHRQHTVLSSPA